MLFQSGRDARFDPVVALAAGAGFLVVGQGGIDPASYSGPLVAERDFGTTRIRANGASSTFATPCPNDLCSGRQALASGDAFAHLAPPAGTIGASLYDTVVTDQASGEIRRINGGGDERARLAGRFFSYLDMRTFARAMVVYDWRAGRETYRIPSSSFEGAFDLQEDGKSAFRTPSGGLAWASPAEPFAHPLPVARGRQYGVRIAADRVLFSRPLRDGFSPAELGVAPLSGPARLLKSDIIGDPGADQRIDFDGSRTLWVERTCTRTQIRVAPLPKLLRQQRLKRRSCRLGIGESDDHLETGPCRSLDPPCRRDR